MAKKTGRRIVKMQSEESAYCYTTEINKTNTKEKLRLRKHDPVVGKHVWFKEDKI